MKERKLIVRTLFMVSGSLSLGIGIAGIFLPLLPTTPFLLLAAACYARGSQRLHSWLLTNPLFGSYIRAYLSGRGVPLGLKIVLLVLLWGTIGVSALLAVRMLAIRIALGAIAAAVTVHVLRLKTFRPGTVETGNP